MTNGLKFVFSHRFNGIIWKIEADKSDHFLAIETRKPGQRRPEFTLLDYATGNVLFNQVSFPDFETWTLDKVGSGIVLLHGYLREGSPERNGVAALNRNGEIAWQKFNYALDRVEPDLAVIYSTRFLPKKTEHVNIVTGESAGIKIGVSRYDAGDILFPSVTGKSPIDDAAGSVLSYNIRDKFIYSFHRKTEEGYNQYISVFQDDSLILEDKIDGPIQKLNPEAFFIQQNQIFYIRNKNEIVSYLV